jgi:hypothetical protein
VSASGANSKPGSRLHALVRLLASPTDTWLAVRTVGWMSILPLLKRLLSLPRLVRLMSRPARASERDLERELHTARLVRGLCRTSGGNCLERSLILYRYLARLNADPQLVVGMGKPDEFLGHVWVTVDGRPLLDSAETLRGYTEVVRFGAGGAQET